ncbi:Ig-like domain-containing protein [Lysinibacillus fusiformis]|uniref:Ig-like domain-containing protein n=1 Tax=Lysinibacillus fusiformis TaxID=28031 RepID=UPI003660D5BC
MGGFPRGIAIITIAILLLLMNIPANTIWNDEVENGVLAAAPSKPTGSSGSYKVVDLKAEKVKANPSVYWTQIDDLSFTAVSDGGITPAKNSGNNEPVATKVKNTLDLTSYTMPTSFTSSDGENYSRAALTKVYLKNDSVSFQSAFSYKGISLTKASDTKFTFVTETGSQNTPTTKTQYGKNSDGQPKYSVRYDTPIDIVWYGEVDIQAEMRVVDDSTLPVGAKKTYKAQVRTKNGSSSWSTWKDVSAYRWSSDKSTVAIVSSNGEITTKAKGDAKITATWKDDNFHLQASAMIKVTAQDAFSVTGKLDACFKDGSTTLKAILYKTGGTSSDVTNTATWTSSDTSVATVSKGIVKFKKVGTTTITATVEGKKETVKVTVIDCTVNPPPDPEEPKPVPSNDPPNVEIEGSQEVKLGETVCYTANASDPDGYITSYLWNEGDMITDDFKSSKMCGHFDEVGEYGITVIVEDNGDINGKNVKTANDQMIIKVTGPKPSAYIRVGGTLKENRKITAQVADAYGGIPTLHEKVPIVKQTLTIEAVDKSNKDKLFIKEDISGNIKPSTLVNFLGKFSGEVKLSSYVENIEGSSDTFETIIYIQPDLPPIIDFDTSRLIYREPTENEGEYAKAKIIIQNNSYSIDGDVLNYFEYTLAFDSKNNDSYDDVYIIKSSEYEKNKYYVISNSQNEFQFKLDDKYNLEIVTKRVGKAKIELLGFETFGSGS